MPPATGVMMKRMLATLAFVVLGYGAVLALVYALQDRLVYFPTRALAATPHAAGFEYQDVRIAAEDGVRIHGWFVPAPAERAVLLHLHGNGGNISHRLERIAIFRNLGLTTFAIDYRGYGQSEGRPSELGTYRDARAAWAYLTQKRGISPSSIVVYGESLGGAVATRLASEHTPRALIIEASFTSMPDLGAEIYPWLPVRWLSRLDYPTRDDLMKVRAPVLIVHSRGDEIVPFHHGEQLYAAAREPKQFLQIRGGHNDAFVVSGTQYINGVDAFLKALPAFRPKPP